ncbi:MAG TPA: NAD(P)-binding protein [Vicinamibacterales bacterium]|nr:NAD(P)-binding protein [Vicinamibacterales bacterium]
MTDDEDRNHARECELGMNRAIARRDFLNGIAVGVRATVAGRIAAGIPGMEAMLDAAGFAQDTPGYYPPALTGMRGSHDGSFDVSHALRDNRFWTSSTRPISTNETYDLVIVGGGISGLAAAYFFRERSPSARILILDNHDDFGGHAKRNEFRPGGTLWIANGGTAGISSPFTYSAEALRLMSAIGIDPVALSAEATKAADRSVFAGLQNAYFFDKETFGVDRLVVGTPGGGRGRGAGSAVTTWEEFLAKTPLSAQAQKDIARLETARVDYLPGLSNDEKKDRLSRISYEDFLLKVVKVHPDVIPFYQVRTHGLYGIGIDAVGALECWGYHYPGFDGMNLDPEATGRMSYTARGDATPKPPYNFHFPDGNASVARLLVRALIPDALPGRTAQDSVLARVDYGALDRAGAPVRIRLSSTAARVRHVGATGSAQEVEVSYGRDKKVYTVRGKGVVLACWNMMIPYICPDLPAAQKEALKYGVKVPLVYTSVSLRNWTAFKKLGINGATTPGMYHTGVRLEVPTVIGGYDPMPKAPVDPILVRMTRTPCKPGLPARDQQRAGHVELLTTSFRTFELKIRDQLARVLAGGGFDPARDIDAITVNRWPHGYAYEYNPLWDPDWPEGQSPCELGRKPFGRITIANSDAGAAAYTDSAIDQAFRAVKELTAAEGSG